MQPVQLEVVNAPAKEPATFVRPPRRAERRATRAARKAFVRLPGSRKPFKNEAETMNAMQKIIEKGGSPLDRQIELLALPLPHSRGHGARYRPSQRVIGGAWSQDRSKYSPHEEERRRKRDTHKLQPRPDSYDRAGLIAFAEAIVARQKSAPQAPA